MQDDLENVPLDRSRRCLATIEALNRKIFDVLKSTDPKTKRGGYCVNMAQIKAMDFFNTGVPHNYQISHEKIPPKKHIFFCHYCDKGFLTSTALVKHLNSCDKKKQGEKANIFSSRNRKKKPKRPNVPKDANNAGETFICIQCPNTGRIFLTKDDLEAHENNFH